MSDSPKILIVDDQKDIVDTLATFLEGNGFQAIVAYNGDSAIKVCNQFKPALVILDLRMPGKTGIETAKEIPDYKVLFMTGFDDHSGTSDIKNSVGVCHKPIDLKILLNIVRRETTE
jgi:DNA-binding response OmpR family regulator